MNQFLNREPFNITGVSAELIAKMVNGSSQEATRATRWIHYRIALVQSRINTICHELGNGTRGVKLASVPSTAQIVEHLLVDIPQAGASLEIMKIDGLFQLFDHGQQLGTGFHVIVSILKDATNYLVLRACICIQFLELWKQLVVDETDDFGGRLLRRFPAIGPYQKCSPIAPSQQFRQGRAIAGLGAFPFFLALVENFEEQQPGELTKALSVAVDSIIFTHDVLDGFDGAAEIHYIALFVARSDRIRPASVWGIVERLFSSVTVWSYW